MKASVYMITYNHERFIAQAIDSVLMQQVDFDYEIVIGEDCSTDNTRSIVIDYQNRFPDRIKSLLNEKNLGMMPNFIQTMQACKGQYIAMLEGDDYWTDPHKLQKQVDFLDRHPEFAICSHNVKVKREGSMQSHEWLGARHKEVSTLEDLLRNGSGGATCSLVFRNGVFGDYPEWYYTIHGGDWALQVLCASCGKLRYFREVMGVFRRHDRNYIYYQALAAKAKGEEVIAIPSRECLQICDVLNRHFNYRYKKLIQKHKAYWYWIGAVEYTRYGKKDLARVYFLKALPHIFPLPHWLTFRELLKSLSIFLLAPIFIAFLHSVKSLTKSLLGLV